MFDILVHFRKLRKMLTFYFLLIWNRPGQMQNKINQQKFPVEQVLWKNTGHHIALQGKGKINFKSFSSFQLQTDRLNK